MIFIALNNEVIEKEGKQQKAINMVLWNSYKHQQSKSILQAKVGNQMA